MLNHFDYLYEFTTITSYHAQKASYPQRVEVYYTSIYIPVYVVADSEHDLPVLANQSQFIAWAIGPRATEEGLGNLAFFHTEYPRNGGTILCELYLFLYSQYRFYNTIFGNNKFCHLCCINCFY